MSWHGNADSTIEIQSHRGWLGFLLAFSIFVLETSAQDGATFKISGSPTRAPFAIIKAPCGPLFMRGSSLDEDRFFSQSECEDVI